jgi:Niemann-Pick C1 protein
MNVLGLLARFGINYDYLSLVALQMSVGLCVDYAVHIGHTFMTIQHADKRERAIRSVMDIGTSVFHGGFSTLLMFTIGGASNSYADRVLLKCFLMVISFGLYHGMVVLPIMLSWFGPAPYPVKQVEKKEVPTVAKRVDDSNFTMVTRL